MLSSASPWIYKLAVLQDVLSKCMRAAELNTSETTSILLDIFLSDLRSVWDAYVTYTVCILCWISNAHFFIVYSYLKFYILEEVVWAIYLTVET